MTTLKKNLPRASVDDADDAVPNVNNFMEGAAPTEPTDNVRRILLTNKIDRDTGESPKVRRRPRGISMASAIRAATGARTAVQVPANVFDAYKKYCDKALLSPQDGIVESAHKLARQLHDRPDLLMLDVAEGVRIVEWGRAHGVRYINVRLHRDTITLVESAQRANPMGAISHQALASRAILNVCESFFVTPNGSNV
jgi:hypothetical protein